MFQNFLIEYEKIKIGTGLYIFYFLLSFTIYPYYQIGRVETVLNNVFKKKVVNSNLIVISMILFGISLFLYIAEEGPVSETTEIIAGFIGVINFIIAIVISFNISRELEFLIIKEKIKIPDKCKFSVFLLLIFNVVYINYKLNQFVELELKK